MATGYDVWAEIWPDLAKRGVAAPVRVGMDRRTGRILVGWPHVEQSIEMLFETRFHERVLRRWVGSFVPHMLGESGVQSTILRFYGAIITAIDLWEPCYRVQRVRMQTSEGEGPERALETLTSTDEYRMGTAEFQIEGIYMPRGHLGDFTPENSRSLNLRGNGAGGWERF